MYKQPLKDHRSETKLLGMREKEITPNREASDSVQGSVTFPRHSGKEKRKLRVTLKTETQQQLENMQQGKNPRMNIYHRQWLVNVSSCD